MSGRKLKILVALVLLAALGGGVWWWFNRDQPRYEAAFAERIWIEYPAGVLVDSSEFKGVAIDELLREREIGFLSGTTSSLGGGDPEKAGLEVDEVELAVDLEILEAKALVKELQEMGLVPKAAKFEAGSYPRSWPE